MTLEEALERIKFLDPYYRKYNEACAERDNWKAERDVWQKQCLQYAIPEPPPIIRIISADEVIRLFLEIFPSTADNLNAVYKIFDGEFQLTAIQDIRRFLEWDRTNFMSFESEITDCDDFAAHLFGNFACQGWSGLPIFLVVGDLYGGHAFCAAIAADEEKMPRIYFLEPQTDLEISQEVVAEMKYPLVISH